MTDTAILEKPRRNYQLDVLKLVLTLCVFISHTDPFIGENTRFVMPSWLGGTSVFFFFVISGFLMVKSFDRKHSEDDPSKQAINYVFQKFKRISCPYWSSLLIATVVYICIYIYIQKTNLIVPLLEQIFPEVLAISFCGVMNIEVNAPTWYISVMLICMLPLYYILAKNRNFYLYVFSPLLTLFTFGYLYNLDNPFGHRIEYNGLVMGGVIVGFFGLSFGAVSYLVYNWLVNRTYSKKYSLPITIFEGAAYLVFGIIWLTPHQSKSALFPAMVLVPIAIALSFSERSYFSKLFRFSWMKYCAPISLAIYFNHFSARRIVQTYFPGLSYKISVLLMALFTGALILVYLLLLKLWKLISKKLQDKKAAQISN